MILDIEVSTAKLRNCYWNCIVVISLWHKILYIKSIIVQLLYLNAHIFQHCRIMTKNQAIIWFNDYKDGILNTFYNHKHDYSMEKISNTTTVGYNFCQFIYYIDKKFSYFSYCLYWFWWRVIVVFVVINLTVLVIISRFSNFQYMVP